MPSSPVFPAARIREGMYESFYLRAFSPAEPRGVWIRYTVHKRPGHPPRGSVWCTLFDASRPQPFQHKLTSDTLTVPAGAWIGVGADAVMGLDHAEGACGEASWSLRFASAEPELRHLAPELLYRAPVPRTKLTSPLPAARFSGTFELAGERTSLDDWVGMVGHNWGAEHAERWIWLHGMAFAQDESAWLDVGLGRVLLAGRLTPWVANGALSVGGGRQRLGGLLARRAHVTEDATGCTVALALGGEGIRRGARAEIRASAPGGTAAGWRYADPDGSEHDVVNCSIATIEVAFDTRDGGRRTLHSGHGGAYELGMRERDHGVPIASFPDG